MDKKTLPLIIIGIGALVFIVGCCVVQSLVILPSVFSSTPDHYGVFLKHGRSFADMRPYEGGPSSESTVGIPTTSSSKPEFVLWDPSINLSYLVLMNMDNDEEIDFTTSPGKNGMVEVKVSSALQPGLYCFVQGDPWAYPLNHWCFRQK